MLHTTHRYKRGEEMKIGIFTDCYYPQVNGVVTSILMLEEELIKLGHEVTIVTVKVPHHIDDKPNVLRINSIPFAKWKEFRLGVPFFSETYKSIKHMNFDVIHTHTEFSVGVLGKYMARSLEIPCIHTYHTMYEDYTHYIYNLKHGKNVVKRIIKKGSKQYVKKYDGIIAPTDKTRYALRSYGVKNDIYVVPTGIDLHAFHKYDIDNPKIKNILNKYNITQDDNIILSLGRVSEEKSIQTIINQMDSILRVNPNTKLIIVGDGPYKKKLEKLCQSLNLAEHVVFTGQVEFSEVSYFYSIANVFVSASKTETQGLTIMEAMASGVPVIVYDDLNVKDIVIDDVSGRLFTTEDELSTKLIDCFNDSSKTSQLATTALNIVQGLSKETYAKNAEHVYNQLLHNSEDIFFHQLNA